MPLKLILLITVKANYVVDNLIAKKNISDGKFVKECLLSIAEIICPDERRRIFED